MSKLFGKPLSKSPAIAKQSIRPKPSTPILPLDANGQILEVGDRVEWGYLGEFDVVRVRNDGWIALRGGKAPSEFPGPSTAFKKLERITVLWSSYYPKQIDKIPKVGDRVRYQDHDQPYTVLQRTVLEGSVFLRLQGEDGSIVERSRLEVCQWWPVVGSLCELALKPYLDWRKCMGDYEIPDWFWKRCEVLSIDRGMATIRPVGESDRSVPFGCLIVVDKENEGAT